MRIEGARVGVHEVLEHVLGGDLIDALQHTLVALAQQLGRLRPALAGEHERQRVVLDALAPQLVDRRLIAGHGGLAAVELEASRSTFQSGSVFSSADGVLDALAVALLEAREDQVRRIDVAGADHVVELHAVGVEFADVAREEVAALAVEELEVALVDLTSDMLSSMVARL